MSDILIVDDERDIRELIADILKDEGFETRTAANSDEAVASLNEREPALPKPSPRSVSCTTLVSTRMVLSLPSRFRNSGMPDDGMPAGQSSSASH